MKLIFIYNAERGLLHGIKDSVHKLINPATYPCRLCRLTYGFIRKKGPWSRFLQNISCETIFLYREEAVSYIDIFGSPPLILLERDNGCEMICSVDEMADIQNVDELIFFIQNKMDHTLSFTEKI